MKFKQPLLLLCAFISSLATAGGTPDFVVLPEGYSKQINYMTQNQVGQEQLAKAVPNGSTIVMEVYAPQRDKNNNPITGTDGNYLIDHLDAIAVMEYRTEWPQNMPAKERSGNWGFALYGPDGKPKANKQDCSGCHWQVRRVNHMFTTAPMKNYHHSGQ